MPAQFLSEFILILSAAFIGGFLARTLRLPLIIGFVASGVVFGAVGKDILNSFSSIQSLSQIGVSLLLFTLGFEISLDTFKRIHKRVFLTGLLQLFFTALVLLPLFLVFSFPFPVAVLFSLLCSLSSTVVIVKILEGKGKLNSFPGTHVFVYLLIQDLCVVPLIFLLPLLFTHQGLSPTIVTQFVLSAVKAISVLFLLLIVNKFFLKKILNMLFHYSTHELTVLGTIFIAAVSISVLTWAGLPDSVAAFLAGVLISDQGKNLAPLSEIRPIRDILLVLFFVVNGMLLSTTYLAQNGLLIIEVLVLLLILKFVVTFVSLLFSKYVSKSSVFIASHLTNIGEFAIIIGKTAFDAHYISQNDFNFLLSLFVLSLVGIPFITSWSAYIEDKIEDISFFQAISRSHKKDAINVSLSHTSAHTIICGYGDLGGKIYHLTKLANIPTVIIDFDREKVNSLSQEFTSAIFGDSTDEQVLESANIRFSKAIIVTLRDPSQAKKIIMYAKLVNPQIIIYSCVDKVKDEGSFLESGAHVVSTPAFEAALQLGDKLLHLYHISTQERASLLQYVRHERSV